MLIPEATNISAQIAISFASVDMDTAQQIAYMLEQLSYIDKCDTLGRKANRKDIHEVTLPN